MAGDDVQVRSFHDIPGWFPWLDQKMFEHFLGPDALVQDGDLVELGVYMGKSASFVGTFLKPGETFTVCDLFGKDSDDAANQAENKKSYSTLDRQKFEQNYLALHDELPVVVHDPTSVILDHVKPGVARFVHVDASHLYEHVVGDIAAARTMLKPDAVVVFDDYRSLHTPGVSAAVWGAVGNGELKPVCLTEQKLYGTYGDPTPHYERVRDLVARSEDLQSAEEVIAGHQVIRLAKTAAAKVPPPPPEVLLARIDERTRRIADSKLGSRMDGLGNRLDSMNGRVDGVGGRLDRIEKRLERLEKVADLPARIRRKLGR